MTEFQQLSEIIHHLPEDILALQPDLQLLERAGSLPAQCQASPRTIALAQEIPTATVLDCLLDGSFDSVLSVNKKIFHDELRIYSRLKQNPRSYFDGLARFLMPQAKESLKVVHEAGSKKSLLRDKIQAFVAPTNSQYLMDATLAVFEEMYMNATIDAPFRAARQWTAAVSVSESKTTARPGWAARFFKMMGLSAGTKQGSVTFSLARSDDLLVICCVDGYGSLDPGKFLRRLKEVSEKGVTASIQNNPGAGAGIGCYLMFENSSSLILGVIPENKTVVACTIPIGLSNRHRAELKKSLHLVKV